MSHFLDKQMAIKSTRVIFSTFHQKCSSWSEKTNIQISLTLFFVVASL
jgi:hypothetical protein